MPPYAQGMSQSAFIIPETAAKTLPAGGSITADKVAIVAPNWRPVRNKFKSSALTGTPEPRNVIPGKMGAEWDCRIECNPSSLDPWLTKLMGTRQNNGTASLYHKRYNLGTLPSFAWEERHTDLAGNKFFQFKGSYLGSGQFSFQPEGNMEASVSGKALRVSPSAAATLIDSTITDRTTLTPFSHLYGRVKRNGVTIGVVKVATLDIQRALGWDTSQDETAEMALAFSEVATVTGNLTIQFADAQFYDDAINGTAVALEFYVPYTVGASTSPVSGQAFKVILPNCYLEPFSRKSNGTGLVTLEGGFEAQPGNTAAVVASKYFSSLALNGLTLTISKDGGGAVTVTFLAADDTPDEAVTRINATALGSVARVERTAGDLGGVVLIESPTLGAGGSIQVTGGTAAALMGYDAAVHNGLSAVHGEYWLYNLVL
jgi:hypothetical protein